MLSTNKMAALPTCDDVGSKTKSQRFSDFLCVMHIVPSTKSRFIEFSKDSWSKFVSFGTKLRCTQLCTCVGCTNLQDDSMSDEDFEDDVNSEADE